MMKKSFYGLVVCLSMFAVVLWSGVASGRLDSCNIAADCDDNLFCTGIESCSSETSTRCVAGTGFSCEAGETCNEATDACDVAPACTVNADCADGCLLQR